MNLSKLDWNSCWGACYIWGKIQGSKCPKITSLKICLFFCGAYCNRLFGIHSILPPRRYPRYFSFFVHFSLWRVFSYVIAQHFHMYLLFCVSFITQINKIFFFLMLSPEIEYYRLWLITIIIIIIQCLCRSTYIFVVHLESPLHCCGSILYSFLQIFYSFSLIFYLLNL